MPCGQEVHEGDPESVHVGSLDDLLGAAKLLGRHVHGRPEDAPRGGETKVIVDDALREPKVRELHAALGRDHYVRGLDVPMDEVEAVGLREAEGRVADDGQRLAGV